MMATGVYVRDDVYREHMSKAMTGKDPLHNKTEEEKKIIREKISNSLKGNIPHNKGKTGIYTPEQRLKMSINGKGKNLGKKLPPRTQEHSLKISKALKGKSSRTEEIKRSTSEILKIRYGVKKLLGIPTQLSKIRNNPDFNKKRIEGMIGMERDSCTEETKRKISKNTIIAMQNPKIIKRLKESRSTQVFPLKDSKPEKIIQEFLTQLGIKFISHRYMKEIEHAYQCDIFIPSINLVIEADGNYVHADPRKYIFNPSARIYDYTAVERWELDYIRTKEMLYKGFGVLRLWEKDIKKMDINQFKNLLDNKLVYFL